MKNVSVLILKQIKLKFALFNTTTKKRTVLNVYTNTLLNNGPKFMISKKNSRFTISILIQR